MTGFLSYVAAGAAKGVGDAMMLKAQQDRADQITALAEANKRTDLEEQLGNEKDIAQGNNATTLTATEMNNAQSGANAQLGADTSIKTANIGANTSRANTQADIDAAAARLDTQLAAEKDMVDKVEPIDGKMVATTKGGKAIVLTDDQGNPLQSDGGLTTRQQHVVNLYMSRSYARDSDGNTIMDDATHKPVIDWDKLNQSLRQDGHGSIADQMFGTQGNAQPDPNAGQGSGGSFAPQTLDTTTVTGGGLLNPTGATAPAAPAAGPSGATNIPGSGGTYQDAVNMLRANPSMATQFDQRYGQGAASAALQGTAPQQ